MSVFWVELGTGRWLVGIAVIHANFLIGRFRLEVRQPILETVTVYLLDRQSATVVHSACDDLKNNERVFIF